MAEASCPIHILASREAAAELVATELEPVARPGGTLGLDVGHELLPVYREWRRQHQQQGLSFRGLTSFGLAEFEGLGRGDPRSCARSIDEGLLSGTNVGRCLVLPGLYRDAETEAASYERQIRAMGGIDLMLLSIGPNGRIAFNEPGSAADSRTRRVTLSEETRRDLDGTFGSGPEVPRHALTLGIGTILEARRIVVVGWGTESAARVRKAFQGPVDDQFPASHLQRHRNLRAVLAEVGGVWS